MAATFSRKGSQQAAFRASQEFEDLWGNLTHAMMNIMDVVESGAGMSLEHKSFQSKMKWNAQVFAVASQNPRQAQELYSRLRDFVEKSLTERTAKPVLLMAREGNGDKLIQVVVKSLKDMKVSMKWACSVCGYLDQYQSTKTGYDPLRLMHLKAYNRAVYEAIKKDLRAVILRHIVSRREGNHVDMDRLKHAVEIFIDVGTAKPPTPNGPLAPYRDDFECQYLSAIDAYYSGASAGILAQEGGHFMYLEWAKSRMDLEKKLAEELLDPSSITSVEEHVTKQLLQQHAKSVIMHEDSGLRALLEDNKFDLIGTMYYLFKRVPENEALKIMAQEVAKKIEAEGVLINSTFGIAGDSEGAIPALHYEKPYITAVIDLFEKYEKIFDQHLERHSEFQVARRDAFVFFINAKLEREERKPGSSEILRKKTNISEVLAIFIDALMKRELKEIADADRETEMIERLATLFTFVKEKDIFQEFYKSRLAKRLLQASVDESLERTFLEKLQRLMGKSYTHHFEGMINDREVGSRFATQFLEKKGSELPEGVEFGCQILTTGHWPSYKHDDLVPPPSLEQCMRIFTFFYKSSTQSRTLSWINTLGTAVLSVKFDKGVREVSCTTYQAAILLQLDQQPRIKGSDLRSKIGLDWMKIIRPLLNLMVHSKMMPVVLRVDAEGKAVAGRELNEVDYFALNRAFVGKSRKFKLPVPQSASSQGDPTDPEIEQKRKFQVDATIVRVMKSRKTLMFNELMEQTMLQVTKLFTPQPRFVKARIEDLIERQYLKRDEEDQNKFEYLA